MKDTACSETVSLQEFTFRGIQKQEWTNLFNFIRAKHINIENLEEANQGPGGNANLDFSGFDLGEDIDTGVTLPSLILLGEFETKLSETKF